MTYPAEHQAATAAIVAAQARAWMDGDTARVAADDLADVMLRGVEPVIRARVLREAEAGLQDVRWARRSRELLLQWANDAEDGR